MAGETQQSNSASIGERLKALAKLSIDKLPVLNTVIERMAASCVEEFREYCQPAFSAFVNQIVSGDSWDLLEALSDSIAVVFYCREWDSRVVIGLERRLVFTIIEAMFGGEGTEPPYEGTRPFTSLETRIGKAVCDFAAKALESAFSAIYEITLEAERTETALEFTTLGQTSMMMVHAAILLQVLDQGGVMYVLIPVSSLNPMRQKLERERKPLPASFDPRWTHALHNRISTTEVQVRALIEGKQIELGELARLKPGATIELEGSGQDVILECEGDKLFRGHLGQSHGYFTVTVDEPAQNEPGAGGS
jgi:flagellar motor switch protein FliM